MSNLPHINFYRSWVAHPEMVSYDIAVRQALIKVYSKIPLQKEAYESAVFYFEQIDYYRDEQPDFITSFSPIQPLPDAPEIVRVMCDASAKYNVGPMATISGAVAQCMGNDLLAYTPELVVEYGRDIFYELSSPPVFGIDAGPNSQFTGKTFRPKGHFNGLCTSSGTVGRVMSFGSADAVAVVANDAAVADAAATSIGNRVRSEEDVPAVIAEERARGIISGLVIAIGKTLAVDGQVEPQ